TAARIAFVDDPSSGLAGLAVQIAYIGDKTADSTSEYSQIAKFFTTSIDQQPEVIDGELVFTFNDGLVAKTRDVEDDGELKPVVQLKLYVVDSSGSEIYLGKITTLIGYD